MTATTSTIKRYTTLSNRLRATFGTKVFKVPLDAGFTCPNRDGTAARYGCTFCSQRGSGDFAGDRRDDLERQFRVVRDRMLRKWPEAKYLAYFQAFSNTYAPVNVLRDRYEIALQQPGVVGLSIATRPDCLPEDVVDYLAALNEQTYLWVELGLQTVHERTAELINRAHDFACFEDAVDRLRSRGIRTCVHIINGLPLETPAMMMDTARAVADLGLDGIKIHLLHLLKYTALVKHYEAGLLQLMERDDYVQLVCDQLEILPPSMVIHRLTGDGPPDLLIGPMWSTKKFEVLNAIDRELERRGSRQGMRYVPGASSASPLNVEV